jgi:hypothetical protein
MALRGLMTRLSSAAAPVVALGGLGAVGYGAYTSIYQGEIWAMLQVSASSCAPCGRLASAFHVLTTHRPLLLFLSFLGSPFLCRLPLQWTLVTRLSCTADLLASDQKLWMKGTTSGEGLLAACCLLAAHGHFLIYWCSKRSRQEDTQATTSCRRLDKSAAAYPVVIVRHQKNVVRLFLGHAGSN